VSTKAGEVHLLSPVLVLSRTGDILAVLANREGRIKKEGRRIRRALYGEGELDSPSAEAALSRFDVADTNWRFRACY
jgi:hypothetical protein